MNHNLDSQGKQKLIQPKGRRDQSVYHHVCRFVLPSTTLEFHSSKCDKCSEDFLTFKYVTVFAVITFRN